MRRLLLAAAALAAFTVPASAASFDYYWDKMAALSHRNPGQLTRTCNPVCQRVWAWDGQELDHHHDPLRQRPSRRVLAVLRLDPAHLHL